MLLAGKPVTFFSINKFLRHIKFVQILIALKYFLYSPFLNAATDSYITFDMS